MCAQKGGIRAGAGSEKGNKHSQMCGLSLAGGRTVQAGASWSGKEMT